MSNQQTQEKQESACACANEFTAEMWRELDDFIAGQEKGRNALIPVLHKAQEIFGYLPVDVQQYIADALGLTVSEVVGVVTFYSYFTMQPRGRNCINVCMGTACYVRGAKKVVEALQDKLGVKFGETTPDRRFSLTTQRCFGACGLAPVIMINNDVHGRVTPQKLADILAKYE